MNEIFAFLIWFSLVSILFGLISLVTTKTVFFLPNRTHKKAMLFWFISSFVAIGIMLFMRLMFS